MAICPKPIEVPLRLNTSASFAAVIAAVMPVVLALRPMTDRPAKSWILANVTTPGSISQSSPLPLTVMSPLSPSVTPPPVEFMVKFGYVPVMVTFVPAVRETTWSGASFVMTGFPPTPLPFDMLMPVPAVIERCA